MIKYSFVDDVKYDANDVNDVFGNLVSSGVIVKFNETAPVLSQVNSTVDNYSTVGITTAAQTACKVTVNNGMATVNAGTAIMNDGIIVTMTEIETIAYKAGSISYVYLYHNTALNIVELVCSSVLPNENICVNLATINADGTCKDTRVWATTKLKPNSANVYLSFSVLTDGVIGVTTKKVGVIKVGWNNYKYLLIKTERGNNVNKIFDMTSEGSKKYVPGSNSSNYEFIANDDGDIDIYYYHDTSGQHSASMITGEVF